ncbi:MAG: endonuclease/exonuclease/phosphatase family protein [Planctomycetota bacterium]
MNAEAWNPQAGEYGRVEPDSVRIMTWNVFDGLRTTANKSEGFNSWTALARIVAAVNPDVLILQECGDNSTPGGVDSVAELTTVLTLFVAGGADPFTPGNPAVTSYVKKYNDSFAASALFAGGISDGFNRNAMLSRFPESDLNGDTKSRYNDIPTIAIPNKYAVGGGGGIRGFQLIELDLPDEKYRGDLIVGNGHLKAGGSSSDRTARREAARNIAYVTDFWYNGSDTGSPDPNDVILDVPAATTIPDDHTPVILGGDLNEDENTNGSIGPAAWMAQALFFGNDDGTDRDRSDSMTDDARDPFSNSRTTLGNAKLDYIIWQDSIAALSHSFIFDTESMTSESLPDALDGLFLALSASDLASDHLPVIVDVRLPLWFDQDNDSDVDLVDMAEAQRCFGEDQVPESSVCAAFERTGDGLIDNNDFSTLEVMLVGPR